MSQNILLLILDSLRSDKFGNKSLVTPNINFLIKEGTYFTQAVSSSDGTILSWSSIFTAKYPFKTGIRSSHFNKLNKDVATYFEVLEQKKYHFYAYLPVLSETVGLFPDFENEDCYYDFFQGISNGLGEKIIERLQYSTMKKPWFFLIHAMDLHPPIVVPKKYDNNKFGSNYYEKKLAVVDMWIGKILQQLDLTDTLLIITADHGSYIQSTTINDKQIDTNPNSNLQIMTSRLASKTPKILSSIKDKLFFLREKINKQKKLEITKNLDLLPHEKRALLAGRADKDHYLFDEKLRIPLLLVGPNVTKGKIIQDQVRLVDLFPTISELIDVKQLENTDGRSLLPLMVGKTMIELPVYLESNPLLIQESNDVIGIRTSKYKYFRDKDNSTKKIHLYDLENDPFEDENLSHKTEVVNMMEKTLQHIIQEHRNIVETSNDTESKEIENELRKLGYL